MGLRVIGAGLGRTGTHSLKLALEMLGFAPCYHMVDVLAHPEAASRIASWNAITAGETPDWPAVFHGYPATVDWPACNYYRDLLALWREAKVILTVRNDADRWFDSARDTIFVDRRSAPPFIGRLIADVLGADPDDRATAIAGYLRHNAEVRAQVPPNQLLEFAPEDGWQPLCAFLGVPVPELPYPFTNTTAEFQQRAAARKAQQGSPG